MGRSRKSSVVDQPPGEGGSGLAALAAPVASSAARRWQGRGRTFVRALLRARNLTQYLKVLLGIRLEARVVVSCLTTPFYSDHLRDAAPECLGVLPSHPVWSTGPSVLSSPAWWPCWVSSALCPALDAVSVMLAKEPEGMRDRSRLWGLSFLLYHPGLKGGLDSTPPSESVRHRQNCRPCPLAVHCVIPGALSPCCAACLGPPCPLGDRGWAPKPHRPFFPCPLPQRDLTFFLDCLY